MKKRFLIGLLFGLGAYAIAAAQPSSGDATQAALPADSHTWSVWGGVVGVHWNRDLAGDIGLRIAAPIASIGRDPARHFERFEVRRAGALDFRIENGHFRGFSGGSLQARGGYVIQLADGRIDLGNFHLVPRKGQPFVLDIVAADGKAWFYIDRLMYDMPPGDSRLQVRTMDVRISPALADRVHQPLVADWVIANMELSSDVLRAGENLVPAGSCDDWTGENCNFAGTPAPGGGTYEADLFMLSFQPQYSRCNGCSGPAGDGTVVFTPSSTLKNNVNAGTIQTTIPGQGALGSSTAPWAADIPWFEKFSGTFPPYANDQHPFLIWNMYRVDADGSIEQIGRSGVKHAFLTVNSGDECEYGFGHVLGRTCEDTYGLSNNDDTGALGPRSEIIAATNQWGRCGSVYDADCDGNNDFPFPDDYDYIYRMKVGESQISASANPGATWMFESWYLAREDINIENSMASVVTTQNWNGSLWGISGSGYQLGPAINRWVDPANPGANAANSELAVAEGHARVAVKVSDLGGGNWRYDYAVMNLDFARALTEGSEPNLRVLANRGFDRFSVPLEAGLQVGAAAFRDGDLDAGNDWVASTTGGTVTWTAPNGNSLDWGTLYSFSVTLDAPPAAGNAALHVAEAGAPTEFELATLVANAEGDVVFRSGFEDQP
jgi:hypothetical protein